MSTSEAKCGSQRFKILEEIGKGGFGTVYKVKALTTPYKDREYAMKVIPIKDKNEDRIQQEIDSLKLLSESSSPDRNKIVGFIESFVENGNTYIIMEYCRYGSLRKYIQQRKEPMMICHAADVLSQLVCGIKLIHQCRIAHRDLTTGNVLIAGKREDGFLNVKIADFGLTKLMPKVPALQTCVGTPGYIAPEVMGHAAYDESADVYSLGAILYMMLVGTDPQRVIYNSDGTLTFVNDKRCKYFKDFRELDRDAQDLISKLMCKKEGRIEIEHIPKHPFIIRGLVRDGAIVRRSGSAEQRGRRVSAEGDIILYSGNGPSANPGGSIGGIADARSSRLARHQQYYQRAHLSQPQQQPQQPIGDKYVNDQATRLPTAPTYQRRTAAASNDSAFGSEDRQLYRSNSKCRHIGVLYGDTCYCGTRVEYLNHPHRQLSSRERARQTPSTSTVSDLVGGAAYDVGVGQTHRRQRVSSSAENRAPIARVTALANVYGDMSSSKPSTASSLPMSNAGTNYQKPATKYDWPIPYTLHFARSFANISVGYVRMNDFGRFFALEPKTSADPDVIYEMKNETGSIIYVFRIYWSHSTRKQQMMRIQQPKYAGTTISSESEPFIERNQSYKIDINNLTELQNSPEYVRTGYSRIHSYIKLARNKCTRRRIRAIMPSCDMELRYDGTVVMNFSGKSSVELRMDGKSKNLETLERKEKLVFDIIGEELRQFHNYLSDVERNLPTDLREKFFILELINTPSEIFEFEFRSPIDNSQKRKIDTKFRWIVSQLGTANSHMSYFWPSARRLVHGFAPNCKVIVKSRAYQMRVVRYVSRLL